MQKPDIYLSDTKIAELYGVSRQTVWRWNHDDKTFPKPVKLSAGATRWRKSELDKWESERNNIQNNSETNARKIPVKTKVADVVEINNSQSLIGCHFHGINANNEIEYQGYILSSPEPKYYLVQLFEWQLGQEAQRQLFTIEDMKNWYFYKTNSDMLFSIKHGAASSLKRA